MKQESLFDVAPKATSKAVRKTMEWSELQGLLGQGITLLTANKRLARMVLESYAQWRVAQGESVWPRVDVLPWGAWCRRALDEPLNEMIPQVLSDAQSERIWRQVISAAPAELGGERINPVPGQCVKPAGEAWRLLQAHGLDESALLDEPDVEAKVLASWISAYRQRLEELGAIDQAMLANHLNDVFERDLRTLPEQLVFAGFHEWPPELERLQQTLISKGCRVACLPEPQQGCDDQENQADSSDINNTQQHSSTQAALSIGQHSVLTVAAADAEDEVRAAASWAQACLRREPKANIAVVVLDLNERRQLLENVFTEVLNPKAALRGHHEGERPFNISLGWPLAEEPVIFDALLALRWILEPLDFPQVSRLLRSPFVNVDEAAAAQLEIRLRQLNLARPSLAQVLFQAGGQKATPWRSAAWASRWREFRNLLREAPDFNGPVVWAELIAQALTDLGWGPDEESAQQAGQEDTDDALNGSRHFSSREYQALGAFHECLEQLASLEQVLPRCSLAQVIHELQQLAAQQIFQPQQNPAPILITEPLQALGLSFDYLWLMSASDEIWPEPPRPNPLLPHSLQRQHEMAHATASGELLYAQTVTRWLVHSAPQVVCSWPRSSGDKLLRPSPLLSDYSDMGDAQTWLQQLGASDALAMRRDLEAFAQAECETYHDDQAPPWRQAEVSGGAGLIREQSACPFRALAMYRWHLDTPASVGGGLNPQQRGILLHRALQLMYDYSDGRLPPQEHWTDVAERAVQQTLEQYLGQWPVLNDERLQQAEHQRLNKAVLEWLAVDESRPEGFQAALQESAVDLQLGPLNLSLRLDRMDHLPDGTSVVIDYKGGQKHSIKEWFGERPKEPQLPMYALALAEREPLSALAFGNLKPGSRGYSGLSRQSDVMPGVTAVDQARDLPVGDWDQLQQHWRAVLGHLAQQFADGRAVVDPRDPLVCQHCALMSLCRVQDWRAQGQQLNQQASAQGQQSGESLEQSAWAGYLPGTDLDTGEWS